MKIIPFDSVKNFLSIHIIKCQHYSDLRPLYFKGYQTGGKFVVADQMLRDYCAYGGSRSTDLRFILFILRSIFIVFNQPIHQSNDKVLVIQFIFNIYWFRLGFVSYFGLYFYRGCLGLLCISLQIGYFGFLIFSLDWSTGLIRNFTGNLRFLSRRSCVRFVTFG